MDTLGAIAICTEPYVKGNETSDSSDGAVLQKRLSKKDKIFSVDMWRTIFGQALYQVIVLVILMYFGTLMFFEESYNLITEQRQSRSQELEGLQVWGAV